MSRVLALLSAAALLVVAAAAPATVQAAGSLIIVNTTSDNRTPNDGFCSLAEAIDAANLNIGNTNNDCADGQGGEQDQIQFATSGTIVLQANLPDITSSMSIDGGEAITIDGNGASRPFRVTTGGLSMRGLTIQHGFTGGGLGFGGAISNGGSVILVAVTFRSNDADLGGAIHNNGDMFVYTSTFEGNHGGSAGGAIYNEGTLWVRNSTMSGNSAPQGAGVYSTGTTTLVHATIARNAAGSAGGGGVYRGAGSTTIANSIIAANTGNQVVGTTTRVTSLVQTSADGLLDTALRDNGGPTRTIRLPSGSAALSYGSQTWCTEADNTDQRGLPRPSDPAAKCDAGAVQRDRTAPVMTKRPDLALRDGVPLSGTSLRARVQGWVGTDGSGIGLERFSLQRQVNGGAWKSLSTSIPVKSALMAPGTGGYNVNLAKDARYRFRVRAVDEDGNVSAWSYSPTVTARLFQQSNSRFRFSTGWTSASSTKYSGGSLKYTKTDGKAVRVTVTGRAFAFVTTLRANQHLRVDSWLDGVYKGQSSVLQPSLILRAQVWPYWFSTRGTHTIRYALDGTTRFDADAIAVLE